MAAFDGKPKPSKQLQVYDDGSSTDSDSDDDLSLCDLPIRAPSPAASFTLSSPSAAKDLISGRADSRSDPPVSIVAVESDDDSDPFEFFSSKNEPAGIFSPSAAAFFGGRMQSPQSNMASTAPDSMTESSVFGHAVNPNSHESKPLYSGALPPVSLSRRSRSEAVRRPPREYAAIYNRSASLEGRGRAWGECFGPTEKKGEYTRLPPLRSAQSKTSPSAPLGSNKKTGSPSTVDAVVPSCGPRPKWYVFATFATVKPPLQGGMDIKDMRTRQQRNRTTQQQQQLDGVVGGAARVAASRVGGGGRRPSRKSWLLNSLSCKVDVDSLPWTPSNVPPIPLPRQQPHLEGASRER